MADYAAATAERRGSRRASPPARTKDFTTRRPASRGASRRRDRRGAPTTTPSLTCAVGHRALGERTLVGTDVSADLRLSDPTVSRTHCACPVEIVARRFDLPAGRSLHIVSSPQRLSLSLVNYLINIGEIKFTRTCWACSGAPCRAGEHATSNRSSSSRRGVASARVQAVPRRSVVRARGTTRDPSSVPTRSSWSRCARTRVSEACDDQAVTMRCATRCVL